MASKTKKITGKLRRNPIVKPDLMVESMVLKTWHDDKKALLIIESDLPRVVEAFREVIRTGFRDNIHAVKIARAQLRAIGVEVESK